MFNSQYNPELESEIRQQLLDQMENGRISPEAQDALPDGTPGEHVSNVTPWLDKIGLWKANDGSDPNWKPKTPLEIPEELTDEEVDALVQALMEEEEGDEPVEETMEEGSREEEDEELTEEEIQSLVSELMDSEEE
jgi:hypothetical protein